MIWPAGIEVLGWRLYVIESPFVTEAWLSASLESHGIYLPGHEIQVYSQAQSSMNKRQAVWLWGIAFFLHRTVIPWISFLSFTYVKRKSWKLWFPSDTASKVTLRPGVSEWNLSWVHLTGVNDLISFVLAVSIMRLKHIPWSFPSSFSVFRWNGHLQQLLESPQRPLALEVIMA